MYHPRWVNFRYTRVGHTQPSLVQRKKVDKIPGRISEAHIVSAEHVGCHRCCCTDGSWNRMPPLGADQIHSEGNFGLSSLNIALIERRSDFEKPRSSSRGYPHAHSDNFWEQSTLRNLPNTAKKRYLGLCFHKYIRRYRWIFRRSNSVLSKKLYR